MTEQTIRPFEFKASNNSLADTIGLIKDGHYVIIHNKRGHGRFFHAECCQGKIMTNIAQLDAWLVSLCFIYSGKHGWTRG